MEQRIRISGETASCSLAPWTSPLALGTRLQPRSQGQRRGPGSEAAAPSAPAFVFFPLIHNGFCPFVVVVFPVIHNGLCICLVNMSVPRIWFGFREVMPAASRMSKIRRIRLTHACFKFVLPEAMLGLLR